MTEFGRVERKPMSSRLLIERDKFAKHVMAGVCFGGKGRLHFVEEKAIKLIARTSISQASAALLCGVSYLQHSSPPLRSCLVRMWYFSDGNIGGKKSGLPLQWLCYVDGMSRLSRGIHRLVVINLRRSSRAYGLSVEIAPALSGSTVP